MGGPFESQPPLGRRRSRVNNGIISLFFFANNAMKNNDVRYLFPKHVRADGFGGDWKRIAGKCE